MLFRYLIALMGGVGALLLVLPVQAQERPPLPLTATFASADGRLTFEYPGGWFTAENNGAAVLGSSAAAVDRTQTLPAGDLRADIFAAPLAALPDVDDDASLADVLNVLTVQASPPDCPPYGPVETLTVAGLPALRTRQTCRAVESVFIIVGIDANNVAVVGASTLVGGMNKFTATLAEVAASTRFVPPPTLDSTAVDTGPLTASYTSESGDVHFRTPPNWRYAESDRVIGITDGPGAIFPQPPPDQLVVRLRVVRSDALPPENRGNPASALRWLLNVSADETLYTQPASFRIGSLNAARARGLTADVDTLVFAAQTDPATYALFSVRAPAGAMAAAEPLLYALATTIEVSPDADLGTSGQPVSTPTAPPPTAVPGAIAATFEPLLAQEVSTVGISLEATYTQPRGTFALRHPSDWIVREAALEGGSGLLLTPDTDFQPGIPAPGEPFAYLVLGSLRQVIGEVPPDLEQAALMALPVMASGTNAPYGSVTPMRLDGRIGASMVAALPDVENTAFMVLLNDDAFAYMSVFLAPDDLDEFGPVFLAALSSVTLETGLAALPTRTPVPVTPAPTPVPVPVLVQTITTSDGLVVSYPGGWMAVEANGVLTLGNVDSLEIVGEGDDLNAAPGQYQWTIALQAADGLTLRDVLARNAGAFATGEQSELKAGKHTALVVPVDVGVLSGTVAVVALGEQVAVLTAFYNPADAPVANALLGAVIGSLAR